MIAVRYCLYIGKVFAGPEDQEQDWSRAEDESANMICSRELRDTVSSCSLYDLRKTG